MLAGKRIAIPPGLTRTLPDGRVSPKATRGALMKRRPRASGLARQGRLAGADRAPDTGEILRASRMSVWWFILLFVVPWCVGGG